MATSVEVGNRLAHLRARKGLTLEQLSEASGITAQAIGLIERGMTERPRLRTLYRLAEAMDAEIEELIGERAAS